MRAFNRMFLGMFLICAVVTEVQADDLLNQTESRLNSSDIDSVGNLSNTGSKVHFFEVAPEFSYIKYREPEFGVTDKGMMYGIAGAYDFRPQEKNGLTAILDVFHVDMHMNFGLLDYTGSGKIEDIDNYLYEARLWVGKDIAIGQGYLTPYFGFGYRWLFDNLGGKVSTTGAAGYDRQSQYFYLPIGASYKFNLVQGWTMAFNAEYDIFLQGIQDSYLSDVAGFPDLQNKQEDGFGVRGSIKLTKTSDRFNLFFEPYIRYWNVQDSDIKSAVGSFFIVTGYEPENTSTEIGARVGVEF